MQYAPTFVWKKAPDSFFGRWFDWDVMPDHMIECHRMLAERVIQMIRSGETTPWFMDDPR